MNIKKKYVYNQNIVTKFVVYVDIKKLEILISQHKMVRQKY